MKNSGKTKHNEQKETRISKKRKRLAGSITPAVLYYLVMKPSIDLFVAIMQSLGLL